MDQLLLVLLPGISVFLVGFVYGLVYFVRYRRPNLRAVQLRLVGLAIMLTLPAVWLTYLTFAGHASPVALLGVAMMFGFASWNIYLARRLRVPPD